MTNTLQIATNGSISKISSGNDLLVKIYNGSAVDRTVTIKNVGRYSDSVKVDTISISDSDDDESYIGNIKSNTLVSGTSGDDSIENQGDNVTIDAGAGNDSIENVQGYEVSISGGAGDDYIISYDFNEDNSATITGGKGNDEINLFYEHHNYLIQYANGDGNDTVYGFNSDDTLQIAGSYTTQKSNSDLLVKVGTGSILLKSISKANIITVGGGIDDDSDSGITVKGGILYIDSDFKGNEIKLADYNVNKVNASARTKKINIIGNAKNNTLIGGKGNDKLTGGKGKDLFIFGAGKDTITDYVGGTDKISISGDYTSKISGSNVIFMTDNGTLTVKNGKNKKITVNGSTKKYSASTSSTLKLTDSSKSKVELSSNYANADASARTKQIYIVGNAKNNSIIGGSGKDTLNGGKGSDTLTGGDGADKFLHSAGNDVITDYTAKDKIYLVNTEITGKSLFVDDVILTTDDGSITIQNGKNKKITVIDSATGDSEIIDYASFTYSKNNTILTVKNSYEGSSIDLADFSNKVQTVNGSALTNNVEIFGNAKNNSIIGGAGSDILSGGEGNDTLTGNNGNDIFVHYTGDDVITDYKAGQDKIQLDSTEITNTKVGENDVIFTTSTGSITVQNASGRKITIIDSEGVESTKKYSANVAEIDDILEDKFAVAEFENYKIASQQENLITFAK